MWVTIMKFTDATDVPMAFPTLLATASPRTFLSRRREAGKPAASQVHYAISYFCLAVSGTSIILHMVTKKYWMMYKKKSKPTY